MIKVTTKRMIIHPLSNEEMQAKIDEESNEEMKIAYSQLLAGCKKNPEQRIWHTIWVMQKNIGNKIVVGGLSFKGLSNGMVEIGYGIEKEYEGQGLMTEAVTAMVNWASTQPGVSRVEAETDPNNFASQRVLQKSGFVPNGVMGKEGPRFIWKKQNNVE